MTHQTGQAGIAFSKALSSQPIRSYSIIAFAICTLVLICDGMDAQLLGIVAPKVIADFGTDSGTFGVAMSAALVGFGLGSWGGGYLGDNIGRRWSLAVATVIFSLSTIGASTSADVSQMAIWRLISGLGFGAAYSNAITLAGEWLPDRWRSVGVTTISVGTPAGGLIVAALTPSLVADIGWRGSFVAIGAGTLLVVILIVFFLRESPSYLMAKGQNEAAKQVASKVLDGDFELAEESHATDRGGSAIGVFDASNKRLNIGVGITFAAAALVAYGMLNWGTTFLQTRNFAFDEASYAVAVGGMTSIAAAIAAGLLVQHFGSRLVFIGLSIGLFVTLVVMALYIDTLDDTSTSGSRMVIVGLFGLAAAQFSCAIASLYALMTHAYPPSCRSSGIGFGIFVGRAGAISASLGGGWLIDLGQGSLWPYFGVLIVGAAMVSAAAFIVDRHVPAAKAV